MAEKSGEQKSWITDPALTALWISGFTILLGIFLAEIQTKLGWLILIVALIFVLGIFGVLVWLVMRPLRKTLDGYLDAVQSNINPAAQTWLLDRAQLAKYEQLSKAPEIWLLTADLLDDSQGGLFNAVVTKKLAKGTKYTFFVPNVPEAKARVQALFNQHQQHPNLQAVFLPDSFFFLVPGLDIAIYNPFSAESIPRHAFMGIPIRDEARQYHVAVSLDFIDKIVGTLLPEYKKNST